MALIIEDGTMVATANSYATLIEIRAYALERGVTLPTVDAAVEVMAIKAIDYMESLRSKYKGFAASVTQALCWPRTCVYIDGILVDSTKIPVLIKKAQMQLVIDLNAGFELMPTIEGASVKKEVVGPIETEYFPGTNLATPRLTAFNTLVSQYLRHVPYLQNVKV